MIRWALLLFLSFEIYGAIAFPGSCGTLCLAQRNGYLNYYGNQCNLTSPSVFPQYSTPWQLPLQNYNTLPPFYGSCYNCSF